MAVWQVVTHQIVYPGYQNTVHNKPFFLKKKKKKILVAMWVILSVIMSKEIVDPNVALFNDIIPE